MYIYIYITEKKEEIYREREGGTKSERRNTNESAHKYIFVLFVYLSIYFLIAV